MDNIKGYRQLNAYELANIKAVKEMEERCLRLADGLRQTQGIDERSLAVGVTHFQTGFMWLIRAVALPERIEIDDADEDNFVPPTAA